MKGKNKAKEKPKEFDRWSLIGILARILVGVVFTLSGFQKAVGAPQEFAAIVETYQFLPSELILPFATFVPWVELILGLFLITGFFTQGAAKGLGIILACFIIALLSVMVRGVSLDNCGCFGSWLSLTPWQASGLDAFLLFFTYLAFRYGRDSFSLDRWVG